jgi:hypothetical protein
MWDSEDSTPPRLRIKRDLPTVILANHLRASIHDVWQEVISKPSERFRLPCSGKKPDIDKPHVLKWMDTLYKERLEMKTERISGRLHELTMRYGGSTGSITVKRKLWEQTFFEFMFEALGYSKNKEQMLKLSRYMPLERLRAVLKDDEYDILRLQSILYGTAGLLFDVRVKDEYIDKVKEIWNSFKGDLNPERLARHDWTFYGLRPQNFPTVRIAYGSQLVLNIVRKGLFKSVISVLNRHAMKPHKVHKDLVLLFLPETDDYWNLHYDFGKESKKKNVLLGMQRLDDIIINVVLPFALLYSIIFNMSDVRSNVHNIFRDLKINPENSVLRVLETQLLNDFGIKINSPSMEQGSIQLYNFYCTRERCKECDIGKTAFKNSGYDYKIIYY